MRTPRPPQPSGELGTPWVDVDVGGREYKIRSLGCEHAFELDAWLIQILGESGAVAIASGLEGVLPTLIVSVMEKFDGLETIEDVKAEIAEMMDGRFGDIEIVEYIGRIIGAVAPKIADLIREVLPTALSKIDARTVKDLVRLCLFNSFQAKSATGVWFTISSWDHMDHVLNQIPVGPQRQVHKWALLLRAIQCTWGPSGPADPTHPGDERAEQSGQHVH